MLINILVRTGDSVPELTNLPSDSVCVGVFAPQNWRWGRAWSETESVTRFFACHSHSNLRCLSHDRGALAQQSECINFH